MKKFTLGLLSGIMLTASTTVIAASLDVTLFPAKYVINNNQVPLPEEYTSLNYNGHAYVPVRFVSENFGANVDYDSNLTKILINNEGLKFTAENNMKFGNLITYLAENKTKVSFMLQSDLDNVIGGNLYFYDDSAVLLSKMPIGGEYKAGTSKIEGFAEEDVSNYKYVVLRIGMNLGKNYQPGQLTDQQRDEIAKNGLLKIGIPVNQVEKLGVKRSILWDIIKTSNMSSLDSAKLAEKINAR
ncbi:hypothetical protein QFZ81_003005 [Paenibacillus sp. V4I9]|jgi:hypothetical protein|uniref:stalk domain-containing protein n=1 Tax=Paenibacillus sp. V4I9 TaxID=3042308 RepID=UPI00277EFED2|nr:stalk domain-containing protein [Paenibacillus sp. V4I9]MDQ0887917.1 hypothetical protein [Paenibacillus sp. V4I9]